jgi:exonuclease SbcC
MKIKKLVLQNINSLYGKWEIDFDCDKFRQSGIFAITGKTGSGKSSILDAMCLALYGKTPRLNKDTSEAVSRGCSECMCELTFLDTEGREWIATFAYEMIKKGGNKGKMKSDALHRLSCNGKTEADKTTRVQKMVEEITGLDSERFCRAVMLAQGSFDAFLNAGKDNGEILERITGTEI